MSESIENVTPEDDEHWEIYVSLVDDNPAVILADIGVSDQAPLAELPTLAWLGVTIKSPDDDGFPSEEEDEKLNDIEDAVNDAIGERPIRYVGRISSSGCREFYFYTGDFDAFHEIATAAMQAQPDYEYDIDRSDDEEWHHYWDVLYPSPEDLQQINNQHLINQLMSEGDTLTTPRPVDHFANFSTAEDREAFIAAAEAEGFEAVSRPDREPDAEFAFSVGLLRVDPVDPDTIDQITFELFELAGSHHGEYEGWGSKVVKS